MFELSQILDVPVSFFFEEMEADVKNLIREAVNTSDAPICAQFNSSWA